MIILDNTRLIMVSGITKRAGYGTLLTALKTRIHTTQYAALRATNKELVALYWDIGKPIDERQSHGPKIH